MREKFKYAGQTVKVKNGVGDGFRVGDMSGEDFAVKDWCENVLGRSWMCAQGSPVAVEYAERTRIFGKNNNVPPFGDDVVCGKIGGLWHLLHINELELEE